MRGNGRLRIVWLSLLALWLGAASLVAQEAIAEFELPSIPAVYRDPADRAKYLIEHYWDKFDVAHATVGQMTDQTEQAFANYVDLSRHVEAKVACEAFVGLMRSAEGNKTFFRYLDGLFEKYLYDAYSPMRNESLYESVLEYLAESPVLDEVERIRPQRLLALVRRNKVGQVAQDFKFLDRQGRECSLSSIEAKRLLLFFYDPDCEDCQRTRENLSVSPVVSRQVAEGNLRVLAIYPYGDKALWDNYAVHIPTEWQNGLDENGQIMGDELYDLKRMPTLYLLDDGKQVLLKDVSVHDIEVYLLNH